MQYHPTLGRYTSGGREGGGMNAKEYLRRRGHAGKLTLNLIEGDH